MVQAVRSVGASEAPVGATQDKMVRPGGMGTKEGGVEGKRLVVPVDTATQATALGRLAKVETALRVVRRSTYPHVAIVSLRLCC